MATRGAVGFCINFGRTFVLLPPKKHEQHSEKRRCCSGVDHFHRLVFKRWIYYIYKGVQWRFYRCPLASSLRHRRRCGKLRASERLNQTIKRYFRCFCDDEKYPLIVRLHPSTDSRVLSRQEQPTRPLKKKQNTSLRSDELFWAALRNSGDSIQLFPGAAGPCVSSAAPHPSTFLPGRPDASSAHLRLHLCAMEKKKKKNLRSAVAHHPQSANFSEKVRRFHRSLTSPRSNTALLPTSAPLSFALVSFSSLASPPNMRSNTGSRCVFLRPVEIISTGLVGTAAEW